MLASRTDALHRSQLNRSHIFPWGQVCFLAVSLLLARRVLKQEGVHGYAYTHQTPSVSLFSMSLTGPLNTQLYGLRRMNKPPQTHGYFLFFTLRLLLWPILFQDLVPSESLCARQIVFTLSYSNQWFDSWLSFSKIIRKKRTDQLVDSRLVELTFSSGCCKSLPSKERKKRWTFPATKTTTWRRMMIFNSLLYDSFNRCRLTIYSFQKLPFFFFINKYFSNGRLEESALVKKTSQAIRSSCAIELREDLVNFLTRKKGKPKFAT